MDEKLEFLNALEKNIASAPTSQSTQTEQSEQTQPITPRRITDTMEKLDKTVSDEQIHAIPTKGFSLFQKFTQTIFNYLNKFVEETIIFFLTFGISVLTVIKLAFYEHIAYLIIALFVQSLIIIIFLISFNTEQSEQGRSQ